MIPAEDDMTSLTDDMELMTRKLHNLPESHKWTETDHEALCAMYDAARMLCTAASNEIED